MDKKIYKVGISGSYGGMNLGDEAILQSIICQLRKAIEVEFTIFSRNPEDTQKRYPVERAVGARSLSINEVKPELERLDLLILGGGGLLYDKDVKHYLREVKIAKDQGIPVMLYGISAGPLKDFSSQKLVCDVLNTVDAITVRDRASQRLLESIGVQKEITVTADPAFLLQEESVSEETLLKEQIEDKRKLVGMSVREPGAAAPNLDENKYHSLLANAADFIVDRLDTDIIFIPMERKNRDMQHSHAVISQMLQPQRANVLKGDYTPGQLLSIMSHLHFAVGMRLHFLLFAALQKVPFVALPYATKVKGLLEDLDMKMPPIQLVNAGRLISHIDFSWDRQEQIRSQIVEKLPSIKRRSQESTRIALGVLGYEV